MTKRGFVAVVGLAALTCAQATAQGVPPYDTTQLDNPAQPAPPLPAAQPPAPQSADAPPPADTPSPDASMPDAAPQQLSPPPGNLGLPPGTPPDGYGSGGAPPPAPPALPAVQGPPEAEPPHPDTVPGLLDAARQATSAGQLQVADDLVAQAETRLLDRSVEIGTNGQPIETPMIQALSSARHALESGQQAQAIGIINDAIAHMPDIGPAQ